MRLTAWLTAALLLAPGTGLGQERTPEEVASLAIGVAPFELVAPPGMAAPELAPLLAAAILSRGVGRTVSPATLGAERAAEPSEERVRALARAQHLNALVVGRVTRLGERVSLDVRLRDGGSGAVAGTYVAELPVRDPPAPILEHLATQIVSAALALPQVSLAPPAEDVQASPPPGRPGTRPVAAPGSSPKAGLSLDRFDSSEPFSIRSDELEVDEQAGRRDLVFRGHVEARQGNLVLRTSRLEAAYAEGEKQPTRLAARGDVRVSQGDRSARCDRADYVRGEERIVCRGRAVLLDGEDELRGESIVFDLPTRSVRVEGGTEVAISQRPGKSDGKERSPLGDLQDGPVRIRAEQLEATEEDSGARRIRFQGSVEVAQEDLILRAREIEAVYPPGAQEPQELVATGDVVVIQRGREARCDRAVYRADVRRVDCEGAASLREGEDRVTGGAIAFDLAAEKLVVSGGTRLQIAPRGKKESVIR